MLVNVAHYVQGACRAEVSVHDIAILVDKKLLEVPLCIVPQEALWPLLLEILEERMCVRPVYIHLPIQFFQKRGKKRREKQLR